MNLHNYKRVSEYEVMKWFHNSIPELTAYQKQKMDSEFFDDTPFDYYQWVKREKTSLMWRLSILLIPVYYIALFIGIPFTFIIRGRWGYSQNLYDNFHCKWMRKIGL